MPDVTTIEDVASRAGVSVATVSRALRGLPHVSPSTRRRVEGIAAELGYRPNPHASRLAAGRSGTIGVALPVLNSWFYGNVLAGVETVISDDHLDMHLYTIGGVKEMEHFCDELPALGKQVDGLVVVDIFLPEVLWDDLRDGFLPVATIGLDTGVVDSVVIDNLGAGRIAVDHLLDLGHERIGFIGGEIGQSLAIESAEARRRGMAEAMAARGLDCDPAGHVAGGFSVEGGREAMVELLDGYRPTAVFCASDDMAIGAMHAIRDRGLSVPQDVSLVGFDDQPTAEAIGLTTVHQPVSSMAARAAAMVLDRVGGNDPTPRRMEAPISFQQRTTTRRIT